MSGNADMMMGMPSELTQPSLALEYGDGRLVPLEYACHRCRGKVDGINPDQCSECRGKGVILSNQGRTLLAFLKKWGNNV